MSSNYTFSSLLLCQNVTKNCFGHGECQETADNLFFCECTDAYDVLTSCEVCYYQYYKGADAFYYVIGWICCILAMAVLIPEIIVDIHKKRSNNSNFYAKVSCFGFCIFRIIDLGFWGHNSITQTVTYPELEALFFDFASISALSCYMLIILMWIGLYTRVASLSKRESKYFIISKIVLTIGISIFIVVEISMGICESLAIFAPTMNTIYSIVVVVYLVTLMFWSWYHTYKMAKYFNYQQQKKETNSMVISFLKKNTILSILNAFVGIFIITLGLYVVLNVRSSIWGYLVVYFLLRIEEFILIYLAIALLQNYFFYSCERSDHPTSPTKEDPVAAY